MYGFEAQTSGVGGLASQAPADVYFPQALGITNVQSSVAGTPPSTGVVLPNNAAGEILTPLAFQGTTSPMSGTAAPSGQASTVPGVPVSQQQAHWSSVLDFHNSVAPWVLLGILLLYGWIHLSVRGPGRARFAVA